MNEAVSSEGTMFLTKPYQLGHETSKIESISTRVISSQTLPDADFERLLIKASDIVTQVPLQEVRDLILQHRDDQLLFFSIFDGDHLSDPIVERRKKKEESGEDLGDILFGLGDTIRIESASVASGFRQPIKTRIEWRKLLSLRCARAQ